MSLDDFASGGDGSYSSSSSGNSSSSGFVDPSNSWVGKLDWSKPYVVVAIDDKGNLFKSKRDGQVIAVADSLKRLDDHPTRDVEVLFHRPSERNWLWFCNLCQDQLDEDPNEVYENEPMRLVELDDKVYYPPQSNLKESMTCQVCGVSSEEDDSTMLRLDLDTKPQVPVCVGHTIEEMALEGLLK